MTTNITTSSAQDHRLLLLQAWLQDQFKTPPTKCSPLEGDASFRRYFRIYWDDKTYIAMDAPPEKVSCGPFVAIAQSFHQLGLNVPMVVAEDIAQGFLLLNDFGDRLYSKALNMKTCDALYQRALDSLLVLQTCKKIEDYSLPSFDAPLYLEEMSLFHEWYLKRHRKAELSNTQLNKLRGVYARLTEEALAQPQVCVHRDYHSRNLLVVDGVAQPGILDFQDAVWGPITYDLLSLLRDCYIEWPPEQIKQWVITFQNRLLKAARLKEDNPEVFLRWFDWIGLQRHLKCIGIFARLNERDNKSSYLQYIPRVIQYAKSVCDRYPEFNSLKPFLDQ